MKEHEEILAEIGRVIGGVGLKPRTDPLRCGRDHGTLGLAAKDSWTEGEDYEIDSLAALVEINRETKSVREVVDLALAKLGEKPGWTAGDFVRHPVNRS